MESACTEEESQKVITEKLWVSDVHDTLSRLFQEESVTHIQWQRYIYGIYKLSTMMEEVPEKLIFTLIKKSLSHYFSVVVKTLKPKVGTESLYDEYKKQKNYFDEMKCKLFLDFVKWHDIKVDGKCLVVEVLDTIWDDLVLKKVFAACMKVIMKNISAVRDNGSNVFDEATLQAKRLLDDVSPLREKKFTELRFSFFLRNSHDYYRNKLASNEKLLADEYTSWLLEVFKTEKFIVKSFFPCTYDKIMKWAFKLLFSDNHDFISKCASSLALDDGRVSINEILKLWKTFRIEFPLLLVQNMAGNTLLEYIKSNNRNEPFFLVHAVRKWYVFWMDFKVLFLSKKAEDNSNERRESNSKDDSEVVLNVNRSDYCKYIRKVFSSILNDRFFLKDVLSDDVSLNSVSYFPNVLLDYIDFLDSSRRCTQIEELKTNLKYTVKFAMLITDSTFHFNFHNKRNEILSLLNFIDDPHLSKSVAKIFQIERNPEKYWIRYISPCIEKLFCDGMLSPSEWHSFNSDLSYFFVHIYPCSSVYRKSYLSSSIFRLLNEEMKVITENTDSYQVFLFYQDLHTRYCTFKALLSEVFDKHCPQYDERSKGEVENFHMVLLHSWTRSILRICEHLFKYFLRQLLQKRGGMDCDETILGRLSAELWNNRNDPEWLNFQKDWLQSYLNHVGASLSPLAADHANDCCAYVDWVIKQADIEKYYVENFLRSDIEDAAYKVLGKLFFIDGKEPLKKFFFEYLEGNDLGRIQKLCLEAQTFRQLHGISDIFGQYIEHILRKEVSLMKERIHSDPSELLKAMFVVHTRSSELLNSKLLNLPEFAASRDEVFHIYFNDISLFKENLEHGILFESDSEFAPCDLAIAYCERLLNTASKVQADSFRRSIDQLMSILYYLVNKDYFMCAYRNALGRRLLISEKLNMDMEEYVLNKLKEINVPFELMSQTEFMLKDVHSSLELSKQFEEQSSNKYNVVSFILNSAVWTKPHDREINIPSEIMHAAEELRNFYKTSLPGKVVKPNYSMSTGFVDFVTNQGKYKLYLTCPQIAVLYVWNSKPSERRSLAQISSLTNIGTNEMKKILWFLSEQPQFHSQLLLYEPKCSSYQMFTNSTEFWLNMEFVVHKDGKIKRSGKLNLIGRSFYQEKDEMQLAMGSTIVYLRFDRCKEAIVHIMKRSRRLGINELTSRAIALLSNCFKAKPSLINETIEFLIQNRYVRRSEEDQNILEYIP